jgi:hypothetical protein
MIGTTEASKLLCISPRRLTSLLKDGRVEGAFKVSGIWVIPLFNGLPAIKEAKAGPKGTWKKAKSQDS